MPSSLAFAATALLATGVAALPSPKSCADLYEKAKHTLPLYKTARAAEANYEADITVGSQTLRAFLDTGSSDTWFMPEGYQCLNQTTLQAMPSDQCGWSGTKLDPEPSYLEIPGEHINISYAVGSSILASTGYSPLSFAGVDVPKQQIGIVKTAATQYPGKASGLVGLAYPIVTRNFQDSDPSDDKACNFSIGAINTDCNQKTYSPLLSTMFADGLTSPVFSFAMSRSDSDGGLMALGGIPDLNDPKINVTKDSTQVTVPIEKLDGITDYAYYVTTVDGLQYKGAHEGAGKQQFMVDTGTVPMTVGKEVADQFTALFEPPGTVADGIYIVNCSATAPALAIEIGGTVFGINAEDLILPTEQSETICMSGIQGQTSTEKGPAILGSAFLRSVLAVFDVGKTQMTFASRVYYQV